MPQDSDMTFQRKSPRGRGGRGEPAREEGPGGRPGRSRHKPTTGPGQITIEITFEIEAPAGTRNSERETTRGHTEENNTGGEKQRVSKKMTRRSKETDTQEPAAYLVDLKQD